MKFRVFFYNGEDFSTGTWISAEEAYTEGFIEFDGCELKAADECTIICPYVGFSDSNGREVYDGDKFVSSGYERSIQYRDGGFGYEGIGGDFIGFAGHNHFDWLLKNMVLVGNIFGVRCDI